MNVATMYLSRKDLEQIARPVIDLYKYSRVPQHHLCYNVDPTELANLLGYKVEYAHLTQDGSILGQTATVPLWTTIIDITLGETYYYLDGHTILIEKRLLCTPLAIGRRNFTIAHELAHLLLNQHSLSVDGTQYRHCCYNRKIVKKEVTNWYEWQADALAAALLLPPDAVRDGMFVCGLGEKMRLLSRKYSETNYHRFCDMADYLQVSRTALAYRMEQLGLLERNLLVQEAKARKGAA